VVRPPALLLYPITKVELTCCWVGHARLGKAQSAFTEAELQPMTDLFVTLATENGYDRNTPINIMRVQTAHIVSSLLQIRGRNTALKEVG
jgi:hypothetical protein